MCPDIFKIRLEVECKMHALDVDLGVGLQEQSHSRCLLCTADKPGQCGRKSGSLYVTLNPAKNDTLICQLTHFESDILYFYVKQ